MPRVITIISNLDPDKLDTDDHDQKIAIATRGMQIEAVDVELFPCTAWDGVTVSALSIRTTVNMTTSRSRSRFTGTKICTVIDKTWPDNPDLERHNLKVNAVPRLVYTTTTQTLMTVLKTGRTSVYPTEMLFIATTVVHQ